LAHTHHNDHGHDHTGSNNARRVLLALLITGGFMVAEVIGGVLSGSLALLADAAHMLIDTVSLLLAWIAFGLSRKPADHNRSFGYHRFPVLAAFTNGISLFFVVGWIFVEAVERFLETPAVLAGPMLVVAILGFFANIVAFVILHGAERENLNIRGALVHVLGDLLGSVAAIIAAIVIWTTNWTLIDPLLSVLVGCIVLRSAWRLVKDSGHVLLEGVPETLELGEIGPDLMEQLSSVEDVHHVHAWSLSQDRWLVTLHARLSKTADPDAVIAQIKQRLDQRFGIGHVTVQIELDVCVDQPT
jgi:cobalt-zinc-cadmium efflux system protein